MHALLRTQLLRTPYKLLQCHETHLNCVCFLNTRYDYQESSRSLLSYHNNPNLSNLLENKQPLLYNYNSLRNFTLSGIKFETGPSSKVEATVQELKKTKEVKDKSVVPEVPVKKSLKQKVVDELVHYYHGFRLLFIDMKISSVLVWRVLNGNTLSRREYRLLIRTVGDMFRLVPFSVFIIVPFMELLLPVFIKFFPGMLPSTFQTTKEKEGKIKANLKVKLEMAKFLQETLDDMAVQHKEHKSDRAKAFSEWFTKVRTSGEFVSNEDIMKFSKLFEDEITLDSLSRSQLIALCRVLEVQTLGTNNFLRFQLRMKLRSLAADDKMIQKEGVQSLTLAEVQQACRARGMRAYGIPEERLRSQLTQWLDLSLNEKVPPSLLLLSRALMLPETIPTGDKLKATISALPETIVTHTKAAIGEKEGKIDNKVKLEVLKEEERKVKEERKEQNEEQKKRDLELLVDKAPVISLESEPHLKEKAGVVESPKKEETIETKDFEIIENAMDSVSKEKRLLVAKEEIEDLKEQMADYKEDVEDLAKEVATQPKPEIRESVAAQRLFKSVNKMIHQLDHVMVSLEKKEQQLKKDLAVKESDTAKEELLKIDDIMAAIKQIQDIPDQSRIDYIVKVLKKMDDDRDGAIKVEDVLKVIQIIGKENVQLGDKQIDELIELMDKEEILEVEDKIEKTLLKDNAAKSQDAKTKAKFATKEIIAPPVDSIDKPPKDSSKML